MFLWSFLNPQHELRARELIEQAAPGLPVNLSSDIAPTLGEFERANTTLMNAYLAPGADRDFAEIDARLRERGLRQPLLLMQSNGGLTASEELRRRPVTASRRGPSAALWACNDSPLLSVCRTRYALTWEARASMLDSSWMANRASPARQWLNATGSVSQR